MGDLKVCENCRFAIYDSTTGTWDCRKADSDELTEEEFERHFGDGEPNCPKWESNYDPAEEAYIEKMMGV